MIELVINPSTSGPQLAARIETRQKWAGLDLEAGAVRRRGEALLGRTSASQSTRD
jgi:hypothetical protein